MSTGRPVPNGSRSAGHGLDKYPLWIGEPYSTDALSTDARARQSLVEKTLASHPSAVTHVTAPHFYVTDDRTAHLNIDLAERTRLSSTKATRAVVTISTTVLGHLSMNLPAEYAGAGIRAIEVRLSPFGGDDEGIRKIRKAFSFLDEFRERGMSLTLGLSGNIGRAALALGHADAYSVGVGLLEKVNHAQTIARYRREPDPEKDQGGVPQPASTSPGWWPPSPPKRRENFWVTPIFGLVSDAVSDLAAIA